MNNPTETQLSNAENIVCMIQDYPHWEVGISKNLPGMTIYLNQSNFHDCKQCIMCRYAVSPGWCSLQE